MTRVGDETVLRVENLFVEFPVGRTGLKVHAVSDVSLDVRKGETLGLVGESGCGKSTTGKAIMQIERPTAGEIVFEGKRLDSLAGQDLRAVRPDLQMIFQDPISSLNPRRKVGDILAEPLRIWGRGTKASQQAKVREMLDAVGLDPDVAVDKRPHQFSGGQCQRISIARALVMEPELIICDEPVSALDVSVQAQVLNLLESLQQRLGIAYLFIAHDLSVVEHVSDRIAVMYLGRIVEMGDSQSVITDPKHPYTRALLSAVPVPEPGAKRERIVLTGDIPSPSDPPTGCPFHPRCQHPLKDAECASIVPPLAEKSPLHFAACIKERSHVRDSRNPANGTPPPLRE